VIFDIRCRRANRAPNDGRQASRDVKIRLVSRINVLTPSRAGPRRPGRRALLGRAGPRRARGDGAASDGAARAASLTAREGRLLDPLGFFVGGRSNDAIALMREALAEFPRDVLLMQRLYYIYFWQGRSAKVSVYAG
jgi:hypothetical protein